jgi:hypothetical protein
MKLPSCYHQPISFFSSEIEKGEYLGRYLGTSLSLQKGKEKEQERDREEATFFYLTSLVCT